MMTSRKRRLAGILATTVALGILLAYVASLCVPGSEATRLRNALLLDIVEPAAMNWTPSSVPAAFRTETLPPSASYAAAVRDLGIDRMASDWVKALSLAGHLTKNAKDLGAIQSDLETTYLAIMNRGKGYCADFTQVYLGLAHAAGLFVRERAFSFDGFGGYGHAFIEIYDRQRARWLWLDVYNNVHAIDTQTKEPLSPDEFRAYALGKRGNVLVQPNGPGRLGYKHTDKLVDYYRRGANEWYLWAGNAVFSYQNHPLVRIGGGIAAPVEQAFAIIVGVHPRIQVAAAAENAAQLDRMVQLKWTLMIVALLIVMLTVLLVWQVTRLLRSRAHGDRGAASVVSMVTR